MTIRRVLGIALFALHAACGAALAQTPVEKPGASADAEKAAFLAMPEADRLSVQDALVWLGFYNGLVDGGFGKRTLDAIRAYQASVKATANGMVTPAQLAALKSAADRARVAVGFRVFDDKRSGVRIGAPMKLLERESAAGAGTRLASKDSSLALELLTTPDAEGALAALYLKLTTEGGERHISYKAMKADAFFVVSGEERGRKFYLRYAKAGAGAAEAGALRGFAFAYPADKAKTFDPIALAIAGSFQPFAPIPLDAKPPPPSGPSLIATALIIAPGQALTALREADCRDPVVAGKPAKFARADAASGLAILSGDFGAGAKTPMLGREGADLVAMSWSPGAATGKASLETGDATLAGAKVVFAALSQSARGAPVFDRRGALAGIVAPLSAPPKRLGEVVLAEPHDLIDIETLRSFVAEAQPATGEGSLGAAEIARVHGGEIVAVYCAP